MAKDYTKSLNLPSTEFSMRANLPQKEPQTLAYWDDMDLYNAMLDNSADKPSFILHDGPPFSNGNIHMGTAMNKVIKDIINKSKAMSGYRVPFTPGWDNHGMPIESAIIKKNKLDRKKMSIPEFRSACYAFAEKYVDVQREQFVRLGVLADWKKPYLTMSPSFEAREVKVFGEMYKKGYIYKGLKPVYWCSRCETALAEAEIEYQTDPCTSIYVKFNVTEDNGKLSAYTDLSKTYFIIWTTTTWTLPGNLAIALNPAEDYVLVKADDGNTYIVAGALCEKTMKAGGIESYEIVATLKGQDFEFMKAQHPFLDRQSVLLMADYVTMDSGTGCVHTAPGFGADDYQTCKRYNIDIVVPVDDRGFQTEDAGKFAGMHYSASNEAILADLAETGALFASESISHEYPHCWRCKSPIIFRATPQWFCSVESFKEEAVKACKEVNWVPAWGEERISQMVRERADWCISRQRHWGLPIPVFYCEDCSKPVCTPETIEKVSEMFGTHGSNCWFEMDASALLPEGFACPECGGKSFTKETNTLDGWFDSGSSHFAVLEDSDIPGTKWPADMYLEGGDQYRGWFQSSLLTAVGAKGQGAPYREVLTHGWVVDGEGRAMHKSLGNGVDPLDMVKKYGADLVRLWVASADYHVDVRCSDAIFRQLSEIYRKVRNTARILLANIGDFNPNTDSVPFDELHDIDKWVLSHLNNLVKTCRKGYNEYEFHIVYHAINNFCTNDLSKLYVDITKDRVYTERADSKERRCAQTAMYTVASALTRLLAPVLAFTAEEIWQTMPHLDSENAKSVFLNDMPDYNASLEFADVTVPLDKLFELRDDVMKALEIARADKMIGKSLDAKVTVYTKDAEQLALLNTFGDQLALFFITSAADVVNGDAPKGTFTETVSGIGVAVAPMDGRKCDRCWMLVTDGIIMPADEDGEESCLCPRCHRIITSL
ncbi:MAG: isoleucine--tRNA ligase [Ruminococcaceae bacterium]|nr:isoleucine--tRNA ligase [Oscillospiraceae bacterium]